jgi:hypothetical protein
MLQFKKNYSCIGEYLWTDLPDAQEKLSAGINYLKTPEEILECWIERGYAIKRNAVPKADTDRLRLDVEDRIRSGRDPLPLTHWDEEGNHHYTTASPYNVHMLEAKVLDLHVRLESAAQVALAPSIVEFLSDVFEDEVLAFQSLYFHNGSQQSAHQDTAFVYTEPAMRFAAAWIALEDIKSGTGELFYYPRSQKLDDFRFASGTKALLPGDPAGPTYSAILEETCAKVGLRRTVFLPKRGDVLFWSADLVHGGEPRRLDTSRYSFVVHYCPKSVTVPYAVPSGKELRRVTDRGWVIGQH